MEEFLDGVIGVVDANSYEQHSLWRECHENRHMTWEQNLSGLGQTVGKIDDMPVHISLLTAVVKGHKLLFIHPTSQVVDHRMIDAWLKDNLPLTAFRDRDPRKWINRVDAMNFSNVFP